MIQIFNKLFFIPAWLLRNSFFYHFKEEILGVLRGFLSVAEVADFLQVSQRRVRVLLSQGRIDGFKDDSDIWYVKTHP